MASSLYPADKVPSYTFNTSTDGDSSFKAYLDKNGNIENHSLEYGFYNKSIEIHISKLFYLKKIYVGFGDIIDFFTRKLYIKDLIVYLTNGNCGCEARRIKFNKWFKIPFIVLKSRTLYANDLELLQKIKQKKKKSKEPIIQKEIVYTNKETGKQYTTNNILIKEMEMNKQSNTQINTYVRPGQNTSDSSTSKPRPVQPAQISGGCGCRKNKK